MDEFTREFLTIDVASSRRSSRGIEILARLMSERGIPAAIRSDNGPEFVSLAILKWLTENNVETVQSMRVSRGRTAEKRASTAACGMNA